MTGDRLALSRSCIRASTAVVAQNEMFPQIATIDDPLQQPHGRIPIDAVSLLRVLAIRLLIGRFCKRRLVTGKAEEQKQNRPR